MIDGGGDVLEKKKNVSRRERSMTKEQEPKEEEGEEEEEEEGGGGYVFGQESGVGQVRGDVVGLDVEGHAPPVPGPAVVGQRRVRLGQSVVRRLRRRPRPHQQPTPTSFNLT